MASYDVTTQHPTALKTGDILNCPYSGAAIPLTLPKGVFRLEVWGAQGGSYGSYQGGAGGYAVGEITLTEDTQLFLYAGGQPEAVTTDRAAVPGGFNGGGSGFNRYYSSTYTYGQGGGGGSDIRIGTDSLYARVIVAGGGGGSASVDALATKYGGGESGGSPRSGYGASQTAAGTNGAFGVGGAATTSGNNYKYGSGGGGGGWYGGGACSSYSDSTNYRGYNGGGSGFVWTGLNAPDGWLLGEEYRLADAKTLAGTETFAAPDGADETGHIGSGYIRITVVNRGPDTPGGIRQTVQDYTSVEIAWDAVENAAGYRIYRDGVLVTATTATAYREDNWLPGRSAQFQVTAYNDDGESGPAVITVCSTEAYYTVSPVFASAVITPNPVSINQTITLAVFVSDELRILQPEVWYSGELYSGEVT